MLYEFRMPDTGANEVELLGWEVREGDTIKVDAVICRVLSGKAELEVHCPQAGVLLKQVARIGDHLRPGQLVAILRPEGIPAPTELPPLPHAEDLEKDHPAYSVPMPEPASLPRRPEPALLPQRPEPPLLPPPPKPAPPAPAQSAPLPPVPGPMTDLPPLPVFKKTAEPPPPPASGERIPFVGPRKRAADKARQSWNSIPHGYGQCEADATALRALLKELAPEAHKRGCELTETSFAIRALAKALHEHPEFNSHMDEDGKGMTLKRSCDIGIALTVGHAIIVPVIREVQKKDLWTLAAELSKLPVRAREHNIPEEELHGSTFCVTFVPNTASDLVLPVIQQPETAALGLTRPHERAVVIGGGIHARWRMNLGLSYDRRAHDPGRAAVFLSSLARRLEAPRSLA
ncbi:MAG: 2-oxo acid dehydrogenase subunit E2 [Elusimicrobia bacterium]|nr:2-oxo acid dehydrogenase subunit E2 [Elusimicrobiota bacterium]